MGTPETHEGFDLFRLKGSLEQARVSIDAALPALAQAHELGQRPQDPRLAGELITVITALRHIKTTLEQAPSKPVADESEAR